MDTAWCGYCFQHIDFSDETLYCSEECKAMDALPMEVKEKMNFTPPSRMNATSKKVNFYRSPSSSPSITSFNPTIGFSKIRLPVSSLEASRARLSPPAVNFENAFANSESTKINANYW